MPTVVTTGSKYLLQHGSSFKEVWATRDSKTGLLLDGENPFYNLPNLRTLPKEERKKKFKIIKEAKQTRAKLPQLTEDFEKELAPLNKRIDKSTSELEIKQNELDVACQETNSNFSEAKATKAISECKKIWNGKEFSDARTQAEELKLKHQKNFNALGRERQVRELSYQAPELKPFALRVLDEEFNFNDTELNKLKNRIKIFKTIPVPEEVKTKFSRLENYFTGKKDLDANFLPTKEQKELLCTDDVENSILYIKNKLSTINGDTKRKFLQELIKFYTNLKTFGINQVKVLAFVVKQFKNFDDFWFDRQHIFTIARNQLDLNQALVILFKRSSQIYQESALKDVLLSGNHELLEKFLALYDDKKQIEEFKAKPQLNLRYYPHQVENFWTHILHTDSKSFEILLKHYGKDFFQEILDFNKPEYNTSEQQYGDLGVTSYNALFFERAIKSDNLKLAKLIWAAIPEKSKADDWSCFVDKKYIYKKIKSLEPNFISLALNTAVKNGSLESIESILKLMPNSGLKHQLLKAPLYFQPIDLRISNVNEDLRKDYQAAKPFQIIYTAIQAGQAEIALKLLSMLNTEEKKEFYSKAHLEFLLLAKDFFNRKVISKQEFESTKILLNEFLLNKSLANENLFLNYFSDFVVNKQINLKTLYEWLIQIPKADRKKIIGSPKAISNIIGSNGNQSFKYKLAELFNQNYSSKLNLNQSNDPLNETLKKYPEFAEYFLDKLQIKDFLKKIIGIDPKGRLTIPKNFASSELEHLSDFLIKTDSKVIDEIIDYYKRNDSNSTILILETIITSIERLSLTDLTPSLKPKIEENIIHIFDKYIDSFASNEFIVQNDFQLPRLMSQINSPTLVNYFINKITDLQSKNTLVKIMKTYSKLSLVLSLSVMMEDYTDYNQASSFVDKYAFALANLFEDDYNAAYNFILNKYPKWLNLESRSSQPIHDTLLNIGGAGQITGWEKKKWKDLLEKQIASPRKQKEPLISSLMSSAIKIETTLAKLQKEGRGLNLRTLSPDEIKSIAWKHQYEKSSEDPDLANICTNLDPQPSEESFNKALLLRNKIKENLDDLKKNDQIPEFGSKLDSGLNVLQLAAYPEYYLMKMDRLDPRILFIGNYVGCCNSIGDFTEDMAIAQANSLNGGCYVLFKRNGKDINPINDGIIAKTSVWKSKEGNIVFNSWESTDGDNCMEEDFIEAAALDILEKNSNINAIKLGRNRHGYKFLQTTSDEAIDPLTASYDSNHQYLVATREGHSEKEITIPSKENQTSLPKKSYSSSS